MLRLAVGQRDRREAVGQVLRLVVAAPGSVSGRYPKGNTGRASVGLREPMPVPDGKSYVRGYVAFNDRERGRIDIAGGEIEVDGDRSVVARWTELLPTS
jgi:hypothetical protein